MCKDWAEKTVVNFETEDLTNLCAWENLSHHIDICDSILNEKKTSFN